MQKIRKRISESNGLTSLEKANLIKLIDSGYSKSELIDFGVKEMSLNLVPILED